MRKILSLLFLSVATLFLTGCMALEADPNLLNQTQPNTQPLVKQNFTVTAQLNDKIDRQVSAVGISQLVRNSVEIAIKNANIFNSSGTENYKIHAQVIQASQSTMSFGGFPGKMEIEYTVTDQNGKSIFHKTIYNEGSSDEWFFTGQKRHTRSRIVTAAGNANEFVKAFNTYMKTKK